MKKSSCGKIRMTRKDLTGKPVIKIGYCGAHYLLRGLQPVGYMCGVYGWNCDVYDAGAAWIVTGYRFYGVRGVYADPYLLDTAEINCERVYNAAYAANDDASEYIAYYRGLFIRVMLIFIENELI